MDIIQSIKTMLNEWSSDYEQLNTTLNEEKIALEKREFDALAKTIQTKEHLVRKIHQHAVPVELFPTIKQNITLFDIKSLCESEKQLTPDWKNLMTIVAKCNFQNEVNGQLVGLLDNSCKRIFNLMRGFDPDNNLYNATGSSSRMMQSNASVSA